jgi:hypothetical protein
MLAAQQGEAGSPIALVGQTVAQVREDRLEAHHRLRVIWRSHDVLTTARGGDHYDLEGAGVVTEGIR